MCSRAATIDFAEVGGNLNVSKGGTAHNLIVSSGGIVNMAADAIVAGTIGPGTIISGGTVNVRSGGSFELATVFSDGKLNISKGGAAHDLTVSSGGALNVAGTTTSNVTVASGGIETVSSGGIASGTTISGGTLQINSGGSDGGNVTFAANTGKLLLDVTTFSGTVAGMTGQDTIDLRDFAFGTVHVTSSVTTTSATLTVTDGADIAHILLLGNYIGSTFTASSDGFGGTSIVDPPGTTSASVASLTQTHKG